MLESFHTAGPIMQALVATLGTDLLIAIGTLQVLFLSPESYRPTPGQLPPRAERREPMLGFRGASRYYDVRSFSRGFRVMSDEWRTSRNSYCANAGWGRVSSRVRTPPRVAASIV